MKAKNYIILLAVLIIASCSTSDDNATEDSNFYALTVGNSWEYRWFGVNNAGEESPLDVSESITIVGTEDINDQLYYKFSRIISGNFNGVYGHVPENGEHFEYYRDSLGYLVNRVGQIKFYNQPNAPFVMYSHNDGTGTVNGTAETAPDHIAYTSEAGTFDCMTLTVTYERDDGFIYPANDRFYYSDGIGLVKDDHVFIVSETAGYYRKLESYTIQ